MLKYLAFLLLTSFFLFGKETCNPHPKSQFNYSSYLSFNYWYAKEDGLNLAESAIAAPGGQTYLATDSEGLQSEFGYHPGFQIGMGLSNETWGLLAQYTWVRTNNTTDKSAPPQTSPLGTTTWSIDDWFLQTTLQGKSLTGPNIHSEWSLGIDMIELLATNKFCTSNLIEFVNYLGLCTAWIRQNMNVYLTQDPSSVGLGTLPSQPIESSNHSHAWGLGPEFGLDVCYHLPKALRIEGSSDIILCCTYFSNVQHHEEAASTLNVSSTGNTLKTGTYFSLQPILKIALGLGWTSPCFYTRYRVDLAAGYDFYIFWSQNAIRGLLDQAWSGNNAAIGNLYLHGLTATASFCF